MRNKFNISIIFFVLLVFCIQILLPTITFLKFSLVPDVLIVFLTYVGIYKYRYETVIISFILGLIQDFSTQNELLGIMAFSKSITGYGLGTLSLYIDIWSVYFRMLFIFIIFSIHFFIYNFIKMNSFAIPFATMMEIVILNSILSFFILLIIDKFIMKNSISKK